MNTVTVLLYFIEWLTVRIDPIDSTGCQLLKTMTNCFKNNLRFFIESLIYYPISIKFD